VRLLPHPYEAAPPSVRARYKLPRALTGLGGRCGRSSAARVSPLHGEDGVRLLLYAPLRHSSGFAPKRKTPPRGRTGFSHYRTAGDRGGLVGRPSPLVARHPDQVQSGSTVPEFWFASSGLSQSRPSSAWVSKHSVGCADLFAFTPEKCATEILLTRARRTD
jgi:hypothetical protein